MVNNDGFFNSENFLPHGHCFLWDPSILWLHVGSDAFTAASYLVLPFMLLKFLRKRKDIPFHPIALLSGSFVVLCGLTHLMSIWVLWNPDYGPEGIIKALTAIVSVSAVVLTWKNMPYFLSLPSPAQMRDINLRLTHTNQEIERLVILRTAELSKVNRRLEERGQSLQETASRNAQQFQTLVKGVTDYAIYMLDPQGAVISWNSGAERIKGYKEHEIIGQNFSKFYTQEDREKGEPAHALEIAVKEGKYEQEVSRVRKDGGMFLAHVVIEPIFDDKHHLLGFAKITRDITDQVAARDALDKAKEQLHQAQKMEMVGHLTGGIAHDFNNLLQAIIGALALISKFALNEQMRPLVETAQKAAARGARLTQQLLSFSRKQTLRPEMAQINKSIRAFEPLLLQACGHNVHLELALVDDIWPAYIDQTQFQSGLLNLVINARDAMPSGGTLTIRTSNATLNRAQAEKLSEMTAGSYVLIEVIDTGEGMTDEVKAKAIEPFYTTKEIGKGSGLGLSQVYGFVRQSSGQMVIESILGKGTTIKLYFPKLPDVLATPGSPQDVVPPDLAGSLKHLTHELGLRKGAILVVEDDPLVLDVTAEGIRSLGYEVHSAGNAKEALDIFQKVPHIDVLFTDVIMPGGMNGLELAREALKLKPDLRVLMVSGHSRDILAAKEGVANLPLMRKPYEISELDLALRAIMAA